MPLSVSIFSSVFFVFPKSYRYFPTQRMAFPHILPSLPSALNIRIFASAVSLGQMSTTPSPPIPKCRSEYFSAVPDGSGSGFSRQSK